MSDDRYTRVAAVLPAELPAISRTEAERAARKLHRHFGSPELGGPLAVRSRFSGKARRCWISPQATAGHFKGWGRLIHDVSHTIFRRRHPGWRPHDGGHAALEAEIAAYVSGSGWLTGTLKAIQSPLQTTAEKRADKLARIETRLKSWTTKAKRADTAIKKLKRQRTRLLKAQP